MAACSVVEYSSVVELHYAAMGCTPSVDFAMEGTLQSKLIDYFHMLVVKAEVVPKHLGSTVPFWVMVMVDWDPVDVLFLEGCFPYFHHYQCFHLYLLPLCAV